ncbi:hypothetical protein SUGI_0263050 [Cryptomeria japonica]|uniref:uncharacterized protein LOC131069491 n=1 Tax=Cryptomeria japonica TaxID=3369 RepID=UPI002408C324|nr:uncharacterized protein LOC131069491 [Cryptomeria japonica]GLJ15918.1 hypothetical protein SUGI_0263050 [Cryptomeria japonica]
MGNSRFRLFHLMPNVWFYKLRDFGRYRETQRRLVQCRSICRDRDESAISLSGAGFYDFGGCGGVYALHLNHKESQPQPLKQKAQITEVANRGMVSKGTSAALIESRVVAALCSCTTTVGFVWNSRGRNDSSSSSEISDEEEMNGNFYCKKPKLVLQQQQQEVKESYSTELIQNLDHSQFGPELMEYSNRSWKDDGEEKNGNFCCKKPMLVLQQQQQEVKESYSTEFIQKLDHSQFGPELMECSKRSWKHQSKHVIQYSYSGVAGLPSPVHNEDVDCEYVTMAQQDQALTTQMFELAQGPFVINTHLKSSTSQICSSSLYVNNLGRLTTDQESQEEVPIYNMESTEMEKISRCGHSLENNTMFDKSGCASVESAEKNTVFDSFAEVKSSYDPQKDFRESMVEMIIEKNIHFSQDLECLLQCYLSLNSDEYHHIILKVFDQVRSELKLQ